MNKAKAPESRIDWSDQPKWKPQRLDLAPQQAHVWYQRTDTISPPALAAARGLLSADERAKCDRFRLAGDRRDYTAAHALVRLLLSHYCAITPQNWIFETTPGKKPELPAGLRGTGSRLRFSLSHARGIVACAITADGDIGIDVERTDVTFDCSSIASRYCSDDEIAQLNNCDPQERSTRFIEMWTLKEAYLKATGQGLSGGLRHLEFSVHDERVRLLATSGVDVEAWQFAQFPVLPYARIGVAVNCRHDLAWTLTGLDSQSHPAVQEQGRDQGYF